MDIAALTLEDQFPELSAAQVGSTWPHICVHVLVDENNSREGLLRCVCGRYAMPWTKQAATLSRQQCFAKAFWQDLPPSPASLQALDASERPVQQVAPWAV